MNSFFSIPGSEIEFELELFKDYGIDSLEDLIELNDSASIDHLITQDEILCAIAKSSHYRQHQIYRKHCL
jgi:hypothetical protein